MPPGQPRLAEALSSERYVNLVDRLHAGSERLPLAAAAGLQVTAVHDITERHVIIECVPM